MRLSQVLRGRNMTTPGPSTSLASTKSDIPPMQTGDAPQNDSPFLFNHPGAQCRRVAAQSPKIHAAGGPLGRKTGGKQLATATTDLAGCPDRTVRERVAGLGIPLQVGMPCTSEVARPALVESLKRVARLTASTDSRSRGTKEEAGQNVKAALPCIETGQEGERRIVNMNRRTIALEAWGMRFPA